VALIALAAGCGHDTAQIPLTPVTGSSATANLASARLQDIPVAVDGGELTQSVPPPPQVAANAHTIEIVHHLPPVPAHVTHRHKRLRLVKYENKYWLEDADHHTYLAARDNSGHYYPACYNNSDTSGNGVYPLYYDSARDDYYRACSDHDNHYFRCYEDEPSYVYYYDSDPVYERHGHGWDRDYEPEIEAPAYDAAWGSSIPVFAAALFLFPPWHSHWWVEGGWSTGGDSYVDISFGRPYFDYYVVPSEYPFIYANTLFALNPGWRTDPGWYRHGRFDQTAYRRGSYRSFSGYGRAAAAGTLAAAYMGSRAFHGGAGSGGRDSARMTAAAGRTGAAASGRSSGAAGDNHGSIGRSARATSAHNASAGRKVAARSSSPAHRVRTASHTSGRSHGATALHAHRAAQANRSRANRSAHANRPGANRSNHAARTHRAGGQTHARQAVRSRTRSSARRASLSPGQRSRPRAQSAGHNSGGGRSGRQRGGGGGGQHAFGGGQRSGGGGQRSGGRGGQHGGGGAGQRGGGGGGGGQHSGGGSGQHSGGGGHPGGGGEKKR
jgi:hypothetical protein